ncbi:MAG: hypothetical protein ACTHU0_18385 [Kofleriaceae bacterium]
MIPILLLVCCLSLGAVLGVLLHELAWLWMPDSIQGRIAELRRRRRNRRSRLPIPRARVFDPREKAVR